MLEYDLKIKNEEKMMNLKDLALSCFCAMIIISLNACFDKEKQDSKTLTEQKSELIVATSANFAPFEYLDGNEFKGIDMDIAKHIAQKLEKQLVVKDMEFDSVITSLASGNADIALSGLTINEKRSKAINFSDTYFSASQIVIFRQNDERFKNITTKEDLLARLKAIANLKIGVQIGTTGEFYARGDEDWGFEGFSNAEVKSFSNAGLATIAMLNEQVDIVIVDEMPAKELVKANPQTALLNIVLTDEKYAIGITPTQPQLKDSINKILKEMNADGTLEKIIKAYYE